MPRDLVAAAALWLAAMAAWPSPRAATAAQSPAPASNPESWQIPPGAADERNPVTVDDGVMKQGQRLFASKCQRCHGVTGKGNGPDANPDRPPADLTDASRAAPNPDGVLFYKIWNGRQRPRMPAFKTELTRTEVWTVIHYIKTLRR
jgi:mono/diheme cytochrome c family protein